MDADGLRQLAQRRRSGRALVQKLAGVAQPACAPRSRRLRPAESREQLQHETLGGERPAVVARATRPPVRQPIAVEAVARTWRSRPQQVSEAVASASRLRIASTLVPRWPKSLVCAAPTGIVARLSRASVQCTRPNRFATSPSSTTTR